MARKAGFLFVHNSTSVLLLLRAQHLTHPGVWGLPGGHSEGAETPYQTALRECSEEIGSIPTHHVTHMDVFQDYATFIAHVPERFTPRLNVEHDDWGWVPLDAPGSPLHRALPRLMDLTRMLV